MHVHILSASLSMIVHNSRDRQHASQYTLPKKLTRMHWSLNNNVPSLNSVHASVDNFKNSSVWSIASLPSDPLALGVWLQIFHAI